MTENAPRLQVTDQQARRTALLVAGVLLAIAAWNFYRGRLAVVVTLGSASFALVLIGLCFPSLARSFHLWWMRLALALGYLNSRVLLSLMFYGVFTPYGLVSRLVKRDPLQRRGPQRESYWIPRRTTRQTKEQFERLF